MDMIKINVEIKFNEDERIATIDLNGGQLIYSLKKDEDENNYRLDINHKDLQIEILLVGDEELYVRCERIEIIESSKTYKKIYKEHE